jgi:RND family efflux transporter MFP subunit
MKGRRTFVLATGAVTALLTLSACSDENHYVAPPPPKVTVASPTRQAVTRYLELTGNTVAVNSADLVARVSGFVQDIQYQDGAIVKKGTPLFTIEPQPYDVKLKQAQAAEAGAQATLKQAQAEYDRQSALVASQTVSRSSFDQATANRDSAQGTYDQAHANTQLAQLNYDYAHVTAPFDGVVMARQVSVGQFVGGSGSPTVLATIVQVDPIYATYNISERDVLSLRQEIARRGMDRDDLMQVPVEIGLQSETGYPHKGRFNYAAPMVNASTGTLAARAIFDNKDRSLLPGYFVRVRIPVSDQADALLVPDAALGSDQGGRYLLVVNKDNVVEHRNVKTGPLIDGMRVIDDGLKADDSVVVAGVLRAIPGQKVDPQVQAAANAK